MAGWPNHEAKFYQKTEYRVSLKYTYCIFVLYYTSNNKCAGLTHFTIKASCHGFRFAWCLLALSQGCQPQQYGFSFVWSSGFGLMNQLNEIGCSNKVLLWNKGHLNGLFRILIEEPICEIWALKITTINREVVVLIRIC